MSNKSTNTLLLFPIIFKQKKWEIMLVFENEPIKWQLKV